METINQIKVDRWKDVFFVSALVGILWIETCSSFSENVIPFTFHRLHTFVVISIVKSILKPFNRSYEIVT